MYEHPSRKTIPYSSGAITSSASDAGTTAISSFFPRKTDLKSLSQGIGESP